MAIGDSLRAAPTASCSISVGSSSGETSTPSSTSPLRKRDTRCQWTWLHRRHGRAGHCVPGPVELPRHGACRRRHSSHQIVCGTERPRGCDRILVLEPQDLTRDGRNTMQRNPGAQQCVVGRAERGGRFRRDAPARGIDPAQLVHVAQATAAFLDVGLQQERDFAVGTMSGEPTFAQECQPCAGVGPPCLVHSLQHLVGERTITGDRSGRPASSSRCRADRPRPTTSGWRRARSARGGCPCPRSGTTGRRARPRSSWGCRDG